jgi:hypothetical protein
MAADLLKKATSKVTRQPTKSKADERPTLVLTLDDEAKVIKLIEVATLTDELNPLLTQHKKQVGDLLFGLWLDAMWKERKQPENPRVIIKKRDAAGKVTVLEDMRCMLQVKFREAALQTVLPDAATLPDDQTLVELLIKTLTDENIGLTPENARKFVNDEIVITDRVQLCKPLDQLYYSTDPKEKSLGTKLLTYINARDGDKKKLPLLTEEEATQLLVTKQIVSLKDGVGERACMYARSIDELRKLLIFIRPVIQVAGFEFGISDEPKERLDRMKNMVTTYLTPVND